MIDWLGPRWRRYWPACRCSNEPGGGVELVRLRDRIGRDVPVLRCLHCHRANGERPIPKVLLPPGLIESAELIRSNYRIGDLPPCARCGAEAIEYHHWAPKFLFGDEEAEKWPKDHLCVECHDRWHELVTKELEQRMQRERRAKRDVA